MAPPLAIWLAGPAAASHFVLDTLNPAERQRYAELRGAKRRAEFATSRALRACAIEDRDVTSSLSHSGGWAAVAYAPAGHRVGVDIEWTRPRDLISLARFAFDPTEVALLESLPASDRERTFYALWTLKESMAKALNVPLLAATRQCVFSLREGEWSGSAPISEPWTAFSFQPRPDMALAVVVIGASSLATIATIEWPPQQEAHWLAVARVAGPAG